MIGFIGEFYEYSDGLSCFIKAGNYLIIKKDVVV
jgi:hypothetical protein